MSEAIVQRFRVNLEKDIALWEKKLREAIDLPLDEYASGEIYLNQAQAKRMKIKESERELERLKNLHRECFPSPEHIQGVASEYLWHIEERKVT